jgi:hypothetical protein
MIPDHQAVILFVIFQYATKKWQHTGISGWCFPLNVTDYFFTNLTEKFVRFFLFLEKILEKFLIIEY